MLLPTKVKTFVDDDHSLAMLNTPSTANVVSQLTLPGPSRAGDNRLADLDWSYTSRCIRRWSPNSLLTHLYSHAFSVPPRNSNRSSPFVVINLVSQDGDDPEMVSLPQAYRTPLLIVAKYLWETLLVALSAGQDGWMAQTTNIFHISRLCENLFASARVKTVKGGMEKEWRCQMFDRFLARFYIRWTQNDPASNETFWKRHGAKEYNRDVLKHDWKRWSLRGLDGIKLTEQEVNLGLNADQFRKTLILNRENHTWTLEGKTLSFITSDEGPGWSSVSELTDFDLEAEDEEMKPSLDGIGRIYDSSSVLTPPTAASKRLKLCAPPRKLPDPVRLSTLRKSTRTATAPSPFISGPNSATQMPLPSQVGPAQSLSSSHPVPTQPNSPSKPSSQRLVVLIKRAKVPQAESSGWNRSSEMSNVALSAPDRTHRPLPSSTSPKRISRSNSRKRRTENVPARAKRRRIDEFEIGKRKDDTIQQAPASVSGHNAVSYNSVQPSLRIEGDVQPSNSMLVEVSVQTTPMAIGIGQGTQTDDICIGSAAHMISDSVRMPTTTIPETDIAIQAEPNAPSDDSSTKARQKGNGIQDDVTAEMQNNLSLVVDNLVSSKLISLMRSLKQSSDPRPALESGSRASSPTLCESSTLPLATGTSGMDGHLVNSLFEDLRLLREEAYAREKRTREEMRALRHLHDVEVDSLRRRLAYLESQSHEQGTDYDTRTPVGECSHRGGQTRYDNDDRTIMPPKLGDKLCQSRDDDVLGSSFGVRLSRSPDLPVPSPVSNGNDLMGGFFPMTRSGIATEAGSPLPSKAQRKSHVIAFSRPSVIG